jgi:hypothetical protein
VDTGGRGRASSAGDGMAAAGVTPLAKYKLVFLGAGRDSTLTTSFRFLPRRHFVFSRRPQGAGWGRHCGVRGRGSAGGWAGASLGHAQDARRGAGRGAEVLYIDRWVQPFSPFKIQSPPFTVGSGHTAVPKCISPPTRTRTPAPSCRPPANHTVPPDV